MNEKIKTVLEKISQDEELKAQFKSNPPKTAKDFLAFAEKIGVELSEEDIENDCKEMTDEDLAKVAGGMSLEDLKYVCMAIFGIFYRDY